MFQDMEFWKVRCADKEKSGGVIVAGDNVRTIISKGINLSFHLCIYFYFDGKLSKVTTCENLTNKKCMKYVM